MKRLISVAVAALALANQPVSALANTMSPSISLIPLSTSTVGIAGECSRPAAVDGTAFWEMPAIAQDMGIGGTTLVKIDLAASGSLAHEAVFAGSGNRVLDDAALRSAKLTRFSAEVVNCQRVSGSYLYRVEF